MSEVWYYLSNGQTIGPLTFGDMQAMADAGTLAPTAHVSTDGTTWQPASQVTGLRFQAAQPAVVMHNLNYQAPAESEVRVSVLVIDLLRQTARWVRIISVLMFISSGLMIFGGLAMLAAGLEGVGFGQSILFAIFYVPMGLLYIVPAIYLHRYARHSKAFVRLRIEQELESAISAQKSFWKFVAVVALVVIGLYLLLIPAGFLFVLLHR